MVVPHPLAFARYVMLVAIAFPTVGLLLALRVPRNPIGWLYLGFGFAIGIQVALGLYSDHGFAHGQGHLPADRWVGEGGYLVAPIIYGTEKIPTVLCALPKETIRALRDLPPGAGRVAALFEKPRQYLDDDNERRR